MNLPSFQVQSKNLSPDKQMALMRQYLNHLKDDTETELYDIKWDNLSKPLRDKLNSLESYAETSQQQINQINANSIKADNIETLVLQAGFIKANQVTTSLLEANHVEASYLTAGCVQAIRLNASQINAGYISTDRLETSAMTTYIANIGFLTANTITADMIVGKFVASNTAVFNTINIVQKPNLKTGLRISDSGGGTFIDVSLEPYGSGYVLFVNGLP